MRAVSVAGIFSFVTFLCRKKRPVNVNSAFFGLTDFAMPNVSDSIRKREQRYCVVIKLLCMDGMLKTKKNIKNSLLCVA